jgi:hypothetical protein
MTPHLTHEQLSDLVLLSGPTQETGFTAAKAALAAHDHLLECSSCTTELETLRNSLSLFREAAHNYADHRFAQPVVHKSIAPSPRFRSHIAYWAAAAALIVGVALPFTLHRSAASTPQPVAVVHSSTPAAESDEALLDGIADDLSTDVPSPMQPLADPTAGATVPTSSDSISVQRTN